MTSNRKATVVITITLFCLSFIGLSIGAGGFTATAPVPPTLEAVAGLCFFFWWVPGLIGFFSPIIVRQLRLSKLVEVLVFVGCFLLIAGGIAFFVATGLLTAGPVAPSDLATGNVCLTIGVVSWVLGIMVCLLAVLSGSDSTELQPNDQSTARAAMASVLRGSDGIKPHDSDPHE